MQHHRGERAAYWVSTPGATRPGTSGGELWVRVEASPEFRRLRRRFLGFVLPVTAGFLAWFFLYIALQAWAPDLLGRKIAGHLTVVLALALGQFASTFAITVFYVAYATRRLDPLADEIKDRLEGGRA